MTISKALLNVVSFSAVLLITRVVAQERWMTAVRDETVIATLHAEGVQLYECKADAKKPQSGAGALTWQFREPIATLMMDGKTVGRHYAGPNWEHIDGSAVTGKAIVSTLGGTSNDIPWLSLDVVRHSGNGIFSRATTVQRVNTRGGVAKGSCDGAGSYLSVPYSADYVFQRKSQ